MNSNERKACYILIILAVIATCGLIELIGRLTS
jgi:hypothetical protein